jgi:hypothetical protein
VKIRKKTVTKKIRTSSSSKWVVEIKVGASEVTTIGKVPRSYGFSMTAPFTLGPGGFDRKKLSRALLEAAEMVDKGVTL